MKKICALLLALLLCHTQIMAFAEAGIPQEEPAELAPTHLVVGNPTPLRGEFFTWGNVTSDLDVRDLLHGYNLVMWNGQLGMFAENPSVVSGLAVTQNMAGDHIYTLILYDDLYFSDGSKITAWDYAFSFLFSITAEVATLGGGADRREQFQGYREYISGERNYFSGVRVLSDDTLMVTLNHEYLPFFYEMAMLMCNPYPIHVIAPGVAIRDDGEGVYMANEDENAEEPVFSAELLRTTVLNSENGYLSHPSVVSGPYTLTAWDGVTAEFKINPYYKGNAKGEKPSINTITYTLALNDTMMEKLAEGEFGLLNKVVREDSILAGMDQMGNANLAWTNYPRSGLSYIGFVCERATVSSKAVRQAIAWCMDRDQITYDYTNTFGVRVDGYYGVGQWMYGLVMGTTAPPVDPPEDEFDLAEAAEYEAALAAYDELSLDGLTKYTVDTEKAARLLDQDGWTINKDGIREKDGVVLDLRLIYPQGNNIYETLEKNLIPNLEKVGIRLTMEAMPMNDLLSRWYNQVPRDSDMIYLASNFSIIFDLTGNFDARGCWYYSGLVDEALYKAAVDMRKTAPGDVLTYMQCWVKFQERFNEILPMIPVYSNIYFDFYTADLQNYLISESVTCGQAIVGAKLSQGGESEQQEGLTFDDDESMLDDEDAFFDDGEEMFFDE